MKFFLLCLPIFLYYVSMEKSCGNERNDLISIKSPTPNNWDDLQKIHQIIQKFRTNDYNTIYSARDELVILSSKSLAFRQIAIQELLKVSSKFNELQRTSEEYNLWAGSTLTLGALKAPEAIEVLASCLACNNEEGGLSFQLYPASYAIFQIGKPAIPKLLKITEAKSRNGRADRYLAVVLLSKMGGKDEKDFLKKVLKKEKDKIITREIKLALKEMQE